MARALVRLEDMSSDHLQQGKLSEHWQHLVVTSEDHILEEGLNYP